MSVSLLEATATVSRALANPARLRIVAVLRDGELCVCQLTEVLRLAQSTVSNHLRELRIAGLISERKSGRWVYFHLTDDPHAGLWIAAALAGLGGDPQIARDAAFAAELRRLPVADLCRLGYEQARAQADMTPACCGPGEGAQ